MGFVSFEKYFSRVKENCMDSIHFLFILYKECLLVSIEIGIKWVKRKLFVFIKWPTQEHFLLLNFDDEFFFAWRMHIKILSSNENVHFTAISFMLIPVKKCDFLLASLWILIGFKIVNRMKCSCCIHSILCLKALRIYTL